eukprot:CAMPEP_0115127716 /NCGR_PEP_ID=MMETSP0227-20121206/50589_1 /TAXON_ID=89957 /ORGANISM="Polarella glacialis, Strain CCMP 1383" /LENGTH=60 /DNA_ID=CAMNT_0002531903 /DNA_START=344 /DNA_END=526 /DNA_ORIENTATION=+
MPPSNVVLATIRVLMQDRWKRCWFPHRSWTTSSASAPRHIAQLEPSEPSSPTGCRRPAID